MSYLVLARKWRPQTFRDLIGQEHVSQTLKNAIDSGRVAHAFLFTGGRGVGKTSAARVLAKALNCEQGTVPEPCNVCSACEEITAGNAVDVFEIDGASNTGVDDIRELRETVKYLPSRCRYKIFIIDEVHMLTTNAFNALLKTLEEPPPHVKFIFATTEPHKLPITILSRCQRFDFKRIPLPLIMARLRYILDQEGIAMSDTALAMVARKGDGSMRDSLSTLDQVLAFCGEKVADEEVVTLLGVVDRRLLQEAGRAVFGRDCSAALDIVRRVDSFGHNMRHFCQELIDYFRTMTILKAAGAAADLPDLSDGELKEIGDLSAAVSLDDLQRHLGILLKAESEMAHSAFSRLYLEMALLKMATLVPVVPVDELLARIKSLEGRTGSGLVASSPPAWDPAARQGGADPRPAGYGERQKAPAQSPVPESSQRRSVSVQGTAPAVAPREAIRLKLSEESVSVQGTAPAVAPPAASTGYGDTWTAFVAYVKQKKPMLASFLEHGHPLKIAPALLELGYPAGSFQLSRLRDPDVTAEMQALAREHFCTDTIVKFVSLDGESPVPPSILEKKNLEDAGRQKKMKEVAEQHPMVIAALEVFGGEIGEVTDVDKDSAE